MRAVAVVQVVSENYYRIITVDGSAVTQQYVYGWSNLSPILDNYDDQGYEVELPSRNSN